MVYSFTYIIFTIFLFVIHFVNNTYSLGRNEVYGIAHLYVIISFSFFIGCRGFIVTDWVDYYRFYQMLPNLRELGSWTYHGWERGFVLYSAIIKFFTNEYFDYQFISFFIDIIIIERFLSRYVEKEYYILAIICFFIFEGFNIEINLLRNAKAIMLFLISIKYLERRKYIIYILLNILGVCFHISSLIYLTFPIFINKRFSKKLVLVLFILGNVIFLLRIGFTSTVLDFICKYSGKTRIQTLIVAYTSLEKQKSLGLGFGYLERMALFILLYKYQDNILVKKEQNIIFINMFWIYSFIFLYLFDVYVFCQRFKVLFIISLWILLPTVYSLLSISRKKFFLAVFVMYSCISMYKQCDEPNYSYSNCLFEEQNYVYSLNQINEYRRTRGDK